MSTRRVAYLKLLFVQAYVIYQFVEEGKKDESLLLLFVFLFIKGHFQKLNIIQVEMVRWLANDELRSV